LGQRTSVLRVVLENTSFGVDPARWVLAAAYSPYALALGAALAFGAALGLAVLGLAAAFGLAAFAALGLGVLGLAAALALGAAFLGVVFAFLAAGGFGAAAFLGVALAVFGLGVAALLEVALAFFTAAVEKEYCQAIHYCIYSAQLTYQTTTQDKDKLLPSLTFKRMQGHI
jgi:hypothetical protein